MSTSEVQARGRRQFLLLTALFVAPLVAAALFYYLFPEWQPDARTNHGTLVDPAKPLPQKMTVTTAEGLAADLEVFYGRWTLVQRTGTDCDQACADLLYLTRQVRATLNEKQPRVRRVLVAETPIAAARIRDALAQTHPDLVVLADPLEEFRAFFADQGQAALFLIDPHGNWMMSYPPEVEPKPLQEDLKHLLKVSQIG